MPQLVLITGASSGIGLSAAVECAAAGHRVVATMGDLDRRGDLERAAAARKVHVDVEHLDLLSSSVDAKIRELVLKYGPFYGLVNAPGIAVAGVFEEQSKDDVREQFETNVFGLMAATRAVLPSMRAAGRGRIVNVTSVSGRVAFPALSVYAASTHAVEGFSEALRWEVEPFGIDVCLVQPGNLKTPLFLVPRRRAAQRASEPTYAAIDAAIEGLYPAGDENVPPLEEVGQAVARVLGEESPRFRSIVGREAQALVTLRRVMPDRLFATGLRRLIRLPRSR